MSKQKDQFIALLGELFQLNQPELDFGLYRILHARSAQIKAFIDTELGSEIDAHFAEQSQSNAHDSLEAARVKVAETLGEDAFLPTGELKPEYRGTKVGKEFELAQQQARDGGGVLADDAQVYEHLYRFFSRYYDKGDFMSKRYFVAENDSRAAPYAVPYDGREVMLHWANKDQYYIKSSEALSNFTFDLSTAQAKEQGQQSGFDFQPAQASPLKVHFRLAAAAEGEHNNVKESQERFFIIHDSQALQLEVNDQGQTELVVQFDYRPDTEKSGQTGTWQQKRLAEAEQVVAEQLENLLFAHPELRAFQDLLFVPAPTDKQPNRTLLGKYLGQFTARNTMDYFIHKNLGGFLRRELDFYIKNEIIRIDDIEAADAPRVDEYLKKLRVLRKIARRIIDFLAQLEDFQKKLWLKKKFVVETQYCITLDRIPESFYPEIAANEQQREEWVKLFAIDQIEDNIAQTGYSAPLTINFLKENQFLVIDTSLFPEQFKHELISKLDKLDENTTGNLLHSDNQQGLNLISEKFKKDIDCIFIDPPYNTGNDGFIYKDAYCHSSWLSFARSRIEAAKPLLSESSYFGATIDLVESSRLKLLLDEIFSEESFLADIAWEKRYTRSNNAKKFYSLKDQLLVYGNVETFKERRTESSLDNYSNPDKDPRGDWISSSYVNPATREARPNLSYEIVNPYTQEKISHPTHAWKYDKQVHLQHVQDNRLYWGEAGDYTYPRLKSFLSEASENMVPVDIWKHQETGTTDAGGAELKSMFGKSVFDNPKPTSLISRFVRLVADNKEPRHVIDFFAGSGSTGHALINLSRQACNKKYTLIEMGAHFDSVLKPRLQKSIYSKDWNEGKPVSREGISHCLKYIRLESFEDTLNNLQLPDTPRLNVSATDSSEMARDYLLKYWLEFETTGSPSLLNVREFSDPTAYTLKVKQPARQRCPGGENHRPGGNLQLADWPACRPPRSAAPLCHRAGARNRSRAAAGSGHALARHLNQGA